MSSYMQQALELALKGRGRTSPNPAVGAVLVRDGLVVGSGFHTWAGRDHAEIVALRQAGGNARGAGVKRVEAAMQDPNPQVAGSGFAKLRQAGVEVALRTEYTAAAENINESFIHFMRTGKPLVTVKAALTLDGKIAAPQDNFGWITSEVARANVQLIRHHSDAILTGLGTVLEDDCLLTDRSGLERSRPLLRIVLDSQLRIPLTTKLVTSARNDVLVVGTSFAPAHRRTALESAGIQVLIADGLSGRTDPRKLISFLAGQKYLSLMVEAGSHVNWTMLDSQIADKVFFYYAPKILGGMKSIPVAGGPGRMRRVDAIMLERVTLHNVSTDEFAVEAYLTKGGVA
jgi:diaminohydroxyphosphoribosylaminopyrimidine deaminase/5-amino-6-(5-phosphoribosylamino)uracil reductase